MESGLRCAKMVVSAVKPDIGLEDCCDDWLFSTFPETKRAIMNDTKKWRQRLTTLRWDSSALDAHINALKH